jgi:hypothetical protein
MGTKYDGREGSWSTTSLFSPLFPYISHFSLNWTFWPIFRNAWRNAFVWVRNAQGTAIRHPHYCGHLIWWSWGFLGHPLPIFPFIFLYFPRFPKSTWVLFLNFRTYLASAGPKKNLSYSQLRDQKLKGQKNFRALLSVGGWSSDPKYCPRLRGVAPFQKFSFSLWGA